MRNIDLKERTKKFALDVLKLLELLPDTASARVIRYQLAKSGTSVGANYRSACRGRSKAEFVAKLGIVEEEADESVYWMELVTGSNLLPEAAVVPLLKEADELVAIIASSRKTAARSLKENG